MRQMEAVRLKAAVIGNDLGLSPDSLHRTSLSIQSSVE